MSNPRQFILRIVIPGVIALVLIASVLISRQWQHYLASPLQLTEAPEVIVDIPRGAGLNRVVQLLEQQAGLRWPRLFTWWVRSQGQDRAIRSGEFAISANLTAQELLALLISGRNVQYPVTFVEGWTARQSLEALWRHEAIEITLQEATDEEILQALESPFPAFEGSLFPDTYYFTRGTPDVEILRRAHIRLLAILDEAWQTRAEGLPLESPWEALILASMIERESGYQAEKEDIAGVFVRRLQQGMRLQSDPTVIYGMGDAYDGVIRRSDLNTTTPWNTYRIPRLPATPIAISGRDSIFAAVNPAPGTALYFVARGDGSHYFSDTLQEHNAAVRRYLRPGGGVSAPQTTTQD